MTRVTNNRAATVKVYNGYGHQHNLVVYGHVLKGKSIERKRYRNNIFYNSIQLMRLFFISPLPHVQVQLKWENQRLQCTTAADGFFKFEWQSDNLVTAGWHTVSVQLINKWEKVLSSGEGKIFVPHSTQYGFISDIDDTVLVSHSANTGKKLSVLFTKNPCSRKTFSDVVKYYQLLSLAGTETNIPNPFFYVSNSEWNLYDYLTDFFKQNELPTGVFLLNEIKKWYQLFKTGKTKHHGKLLRVARILEAFPKQRFILLGDNSQTDPAIYVAIANKFPSNIEAIYIRNVSDKKRGLETKKMLALIQNKDIHTCLFLHTDEAIQHAKDIGLIT